MDPQRGDGLEKGDRMRCSAPLTSSKCQGLVVTIAREQKTGIKQLTGHNVIPSYVPMGWIIRTK